MLPPDVRLTPKMIRRVARCIRAHPALAAALDDRLDEMELDDAVQDLVWTAQQLDRDRHEVPPDDGLDAVFGPMPRRVELPAGGEELLAAAWSAYMGHDDQWADEPPPPHDPIAAAQQATIGALDPFARQDEVNAGVTVLRVPADMRMRIEHRTDPRDDRFHGPPSIEMVGGLPRHVRGSMRAEALRRAHPTDEQEQEGER